jgi:hypothetical protein
MNVPDDEKCLCIYRLELGLMERGERDEHAAFDLLASERNARLSSRSNFENRSYPSKRRTVGETSGRAAAALISSSEALVGFGCCTTPIARTHPADKWDQLKYIRVLMSGPGT